MSLHYADAQAEDIEGIQQAAAASWRATYKDIFTDEFMADFLARAYSSEGLRHSIHYPGWIFLVAKDGERVVGFCNLGDRGDGWELFRIYVVPDYWRAGIGGKLLDFLEARLSDRGIREYFCYVHKHNEIGKSFYIRSGFVHDPSRDKDDEWYMVKQSAISS